MIGLAARLFLLPLWLLFRHPRGCLTLVCLVVIGVCGFGALVEAGILYPPPAAATPNHAAPRPSRAATSDVPAAYLRLYRQAGARYRLPWQVLAAIGKVESDHGRVRLPGVRSGSNWAGACGPMQIGCVTGSKAGNSWARYGRGSPYRPGDAIPAAARYLLGHGAHRNLDRAIYAYNPSSAYVARVKRWARRYGRR